MRKYKKEQKPSIRQLGQDQRIFQKDFSRCNRFKRCGSPLPPALTPQRLILHGKVCTHPGNVLMLSACLNRALDFGELPEKSMENKMRGAILIFTLEKFHSTIFSIVINLTIIEWQEHV